MAMPLTNTISSRKITYFFVYIAHFARYMLHIYTLYIIKAKKYGY